MNSYIFILCPPYSGSTLLWKLISTSEAVSLLPCEGQFLPETKAIMRISPWNSAVKFPWDVIKPIWNKYWDQSKPLLVEKSPPHLIRADEIAKHFSPVYFLAMIRNPYAFCEGLIRRKICDAKRAAHFAVRCMKQQTENMDKLTNIIKFTYEELTTNPKSVTQKIQSFIPEIGEIDHTQKHKIHSIDGTIERGLVDLNMKKINKLSLVELEQINMVFKKNYNVLNYWKYKILCS